MISISVVIITYNEEKNIARCLDSVKGIAEDIVVLDSFSTDRTKEICEAKGVRFLQHAFDGHIEQKNRAITHAKYPQILSLDADEVLSEELQNAIKAVKMNWKHQGYYMTRLTNYCGKWIRHCGWYPDKKLRLWDSRKGKWGGVNPHDKYEMNDGDKVTGELKGDILHYSYPTIESHLKQTEYFTTIAAKALFAEGKKAGFVKRFVSPMAKFFGDYFFKLGFLDGYYGYKVCRISAQATYLKYSKLKALYKK